MNVSTILFVLTACVFGYYLYVTLVKDKPSKTVFKVHDAAKPETFSDVYTSGMSTSNSHSFWLLVNSMAPVGETSTNFRRVFESEGLITVDLNRFKNDLVVKMPMQNDNNDETTDTFEATVSNIPLQRWVFVTVSVEGRTVDIYIDGKLVRTSVATRNFATPSDIPPMKVGPSAAQSFSGYIAMMRYHKDVLSAKEVYDLYQKGPGTGRMSMNFNLKLSLLRDSNEIKSYMF
jgi:hypothetical protein